MQSNQSLQFVRLLNITHLLTPTRPFRQYRLDGIRLRVLQEQPEKLLSLGMKRIDAAAQVKNIQDVKTCFSDIVKLYFSTEEARGVLKSSSLKLSPEQKKEMGRHFSGKPDSTFISQFL
ncbi:hypothetical protein BLNAU_17877 [Blattamonas nauphoetae]|uniref:Uncharacterized protein n=1 Tax=Blattamonas nauphoetae TaxID=2049346 RepID=A0ABQ9X904_9EUKA|nr:hypothetical protein BLNAU_17877 [Blattamonas nauphoetae]